MMTSSSNIMEIIRRNLLDIQQRMQAAVVRSEFRINIPKLIAVTKYAEPEWIEALVELGCRNFGESRPQQLAQRKVWLAEVKDLNWHQIGHLQRNKVRPVVESGAWIHSIDSWRLLDRIEEISAELQLTTPLLLQINISGEEQKSGFAPEDFLEEVERIKSLNHCRVLGLMTMAPDTEDENIIRNVFRELRILRDQARQKLPAELQLPELSMGMSGDFEIAIEEGATMVRVGSKLYRGLTS
ncbi:YggS family pyridoxal phosphate-dependent enzyme [Rubinisphaera italica]|nr:YggS family pyridoxal phosphate-dependent enzyme [Rubinisphaera italica]